MSTNAPNSNTRISEAHSLLIQLGKCKTPEEAMGCICEIQPMLSYSWHEIIMNGFEELQKGNEQLLLEKAMIKRLCE